MARHDDADNDAQTRVMTPRRGLVVEDQADVRAWLSDCVRKAFPGIEISEAGHIRTALTWLRAQARSSADEPLLVLVDLGLPDGSGIDLVRQIAAERPDALPIVATIYDDDAHMFDAIAAGARGYLLKDKQTDMLVAYLQRIARGEPPLSPSVAHRILGHFRAQTAQQPSPEDLSPRETEVLTLLAKGMTTAEIAAKLSLKTGTIASYVKSIYVKLGISSRAQAAREAIRRRLV